MDTVEFPTSSTTSAVRVRSDFQNHFFLELVLSALQSKSPQLARLPFKHNGNTLTSFSTYQTKLLFMSVPGVRVLREEKKEVNTVCADSNGTQSPKEARSPLPVEAAM